MRSYTVNIFALTYALGLLYGYEAGLIVSANAFFAGVLLMVMYTGYQLIEREGMPLMKAVRDMTSRPESYPRVTAYGAYIVSLVLGFCVVAQTVVMS